MNKGKIIGEIEALKPLLENQNLPDVFINSINDKLTVLNHRLNEIEE